MEKEKVDLFLATSGEKFAPEVLPTIKAKLEQMNDDKFILLQASEFRNPSIILIVAILLGWERFFIDDIKMGVIKILTCQGFGIWWLVDIFSAKKRTQDYNLNKFNTITQL